MGVIYVPVTGELYYAAKGQGAYLDTAEQKGVKLHVSDCTDMSKLRMVMSSSHGSDKMDSLLEKYHITNFVKMGSSLKGCVVAKGEAELYYRFNPTMEWDTAAMQCIVEEAGAVFFQMDDTPMLYNREDSLNAKGFYIINSLQNKLDVN
jgi:3'(2'), 5'-bisphosphate nucleotidase